MLALVDLAGQQHDAGDLTRTRVALVAGPGGGGRVGRVQVGQGVFQYQGLIRVGQGKATVVAKLRRPLQRARVALEQLAVVVEGVGDSLQQLAADHRAHRWRRVVAGALLALDLAFDQQGRVAGAVVGQTLAKRLHQRLALLPSGKAGEGEGFVVVAQRLFVAHAGGQALLEQGADGIAQQAGKLRQADGALGAPGWQRLIG